MELWIRSQDREQLRKIVDLKYQYGTLQDANLKVIVGTTQYDEWEVLGNYKTKERALEVLDEIQSILKPAIKALTPLTESKEDYKNHCMKTELVGYETTYDIVALPTYVYEMPQE